MKAMSFEETGGPEVLHLVDVPQPHAGPGQIRIAVRAAGVNPVDWKIRNGSTLRTIPVPLPHIPGLEAAGVVDEVGAGVEGVSVGDEVFGAAQNASAEYAVLDEWAPKPPELTWAQAAGLAMAVETAARGLDLLGITADQGSGTGQELGAGLEAAAGSEQGGSASAGTTLLVNGAAGGVGLAAVQLAQARGARVIGTASRDNQEYLRSLGVAATDYGPGLVDRVRALASDGVDAALAVSGEGALPDLITLTGSPDRVVSIGDATAADHGVRFTTGAEGRAFYSLREAATLAAAGRLTMPVARALPLAELGEAHRLSEAGHVRGKFVVVLD
ncbi:NADP-dependent oxidoreductase [Frankia sp. AvcI1]|uniref:NADP-dependent oxidoreductase n=2 Tax=Frankia sp. AvcI1 TaxID=573496 RepID=UPI0006EC213C|nr:NADP-dependent oxidoreductase [Frankia sp. AvcI1]